MTNGADSGFLRGRARTASARQIAVALGSRRYRGTDASTPDKMTTGADSGFSDAVEARTASARQMQPLWV